MRDSPNEKPLLDCPQKHPASRTMIQSIVATIRAKAGQEAELKAGALYEVAHRIATLNRPGRLNVCTAPLGEALRAAG